MLEFVEKVTKRQDSNLVPVIQNSSVAVEKLSLSGDVFAIGLEFGIKSSFLNAAVSSSIVASGRYNTTCLLVFSSYVPFLGRPYSTELL